MLGPVQIILRLVLWRQIDVKFFARSVEVFARLREVVPALVQHFYVIRNLQIRNAALERRNLHLFLKKELSHKLARTWNYTVLFQII